MEVLIAVDAVGAGSGNRAAQPIRGYASELVVVHGSSGCDDLRLDAVSSAVTSGWKHGIKQERGCLYRRSAGRAS